MNNGAKEDLSLLAAIDSTILIQMLILTLNIDLF